MPSAPDKTTPFHAKSLRAHWRKLMLSTALSASMLAMGGCAGTMQAMTKAPPLPPVTETPVTPPPQTPAPKDRAQEVNDALLADARAHFLAYAALAKNPYSAQLSQLENRTSAWLRHYSTTPRQREVVLDPAVFDAGMAFGMNPLEIVAVMTDARHVSTDPHTILSAVEAMSNSVTLPYLPLPTYTQAPLTLLDPDTADKSACLVIPASSHLNLFKIEGMTQETAIRYANMHESWHCKDGMNVAPPATVPPPTTTVAEQKQAEAKGMLELIARKSRQESLADVGALGDLIRAGEQPNVIDAIIHWRQDMPHDVLHYSPPVLRALKQEIAHMGLARFRALNDRQARDFYYGVVERTGMTARQMEFVALLQEGPPEAKNLITRLAKTNAEAARAVEMVNYDTVISDAIETQRREKAATPLTPEEHAMMTTLGQYNAARQLVDNAFDTDGRITPKTLTAAYGRLQTALQTESNSTPSMASLTNAKLNKLQESYFIVVQFIDYLGENAKRGVDITALEPCLKDLRLRGAQTAPVPVAALRVSPAPVLR